MKRRRIENNMIKKTVKREGNRKGKTGRRLTAEGRGKNTRRGDGEKIVVGEGQMGEGQRGEERREAGR